MLIKGIKSMLARRLISGLPSSKNTNILKAVNLSFQRLVISFKTLDFYTDSNVTYTHILLPM